ncbi:HprK-related kinase A [Pelomonas sp. Root1217]|uniref:HprK-related kinase A n=1 Tax=Pelomonas sp. Root1217 TaxID=1736430 RepID=UPI000AD281A3|nr:HprK-related kinase A [Pelomonas sp. Root1217]
MLTLGMLAPAELGQRLHDGLTLRTGPFSYRIHSSCPPVAAGLATLYADFELEPEGGIADFHVHVQPVTGLRRWLGAQVEFRLDQHSPFLPLPANHAFALLEWGMNWCLASQANHYLLFHAAVLEKDGQCLVMPGDPGAGKSTLTAALMLSGWRLLSDEMAMVDRDDGQVAPLARPVSLKNQSIDIIRGFSPQAVLGEPARDTHKGTVSHLRASVASMTGQQQQARPTQLIFPRWRAGASTQLTPVPKAQAFERLAGHAFNYSMLGRVGFELTAALIDSCRCWDFCYCDLAEGLATLGGLKS